MHFFQIRYPQKFLDLSTQLLLVAALVFSTHFCKGQFHPSVSPVLRSTTTSTNDYLIQDPGEVVNLAGNLFVGVIDSASKAILYDTTYFNDNCPFGGNAYLRIEKHPKGGYITAGFLNECERDQAIITWLDDSLREVSSYITPSGFEGMFPQFIDIASDPSLERIYAIKEFKLPLFSNGNRPVLLYTFNDSLELLRIDTIVDNQRANPQTDFLIDSNILITSHFLLNPLRSYIQVIDLSDYSVRWDTSFSGVENVLDVSCRKGSFFSVEEVRLDSTSSAPRKTYLREYNYNGVLINEVQLLGLESRVILGDILNAKSDTNAYVFNSSSYEVNNGDTSFYRESKAILFDHNLNLINIIPLAFGKLYTTDTSGYSFLQPNVGRIDNGVLYYDIVIRKDKLSSSVNYLNRINLNYALSNQPEKVEPKKYFGIQPNPARDILQVVFYNPQDVTEIEIIDLQGKVLKTVFSQKNISIGDLKPGPYIIIAKDGKGHLLQRNLFIHL